MAAGQWSFTIEKGADFDKVITWLQGSPLSPVNLTGASALMQVRTFPLSGALLLELESPTGADGNIVLGGVAGTLSLHIDDSVTGPLSWGGRAYYDLLVTLADLSVIRLLEGRVGLSPPVTVP
jgi:hypothetical protein